MHTSRSSILFLIGVSTVLSLAPAALAEEPPSATSGPPPSSAAPVLGGHLGLALPIVTFASKTTVIGSDFVTIGMTPGITVHLDDDWAIDFEFVALNEVKSTPAPTTFVVDPGVVRKFGAVSAGLRVATQVGTLSNVGLVPILVVPFKLSKQFSYFVEGDIPLFLRDDGTQMQPSASFQLQTGVGF